MMCDGSAIRDSKPHNTLNQAEISVMQTVFEIKAFRGIFEPRK
jgi:hypothetical protein